MGEQRVFLEVWKDEGDGNRGSVLYRIREDPQGSHVCFCSFVAKASDFAFV